jgi:hypothetical protein
MKEVTQEQKACTGLKSLRLKGGGLDTTEI